MNTLASPPANLLVAPAVPDLLRQFYANFLLLQGDVVLIESQPTFDLRLVQTLPQDQALLLAHAQDYHTALADQVLEVLQAFVTLGSQVSNLGRQLLPLAQALDATPSSPDPTVLARFRALLEQLQTMATGTAPDSASTYLLVQQGQRATQDFYATKLEVDQANFTATLQAVITTGVLTQLVQQLASLQTQLDTANQNMAKGATDQVVDALGFTFSLGAVAAGTIAALPVAIGVAVAVTSEAQAASGHAKQWQQDYDNLNNLLGQYMAVATALASEQQQFAVLQTLASQATAFGQHMAAAGQALDGLTHALQGLANGFGQLLAFTESPSEGYLTGQVMAAIKFWGDVQADCQTWLAAAAGFSAAARPAALRRKLLA